MREVEEKRRELGEVAAAVAATAAARDGGGGYVPCKFPGKVI